jgi:hypothetical protein
MLKLITREWDGQVPSSDEWHKDLLNQMSEETAKRPAVLSPALVEVLGEFLAFRHLFRGASIALMKWEKVSPVGCKGSPNLRIKRKQRSAPSSVSLSGNCDSSTATRVQAVRIHYGTGLLTGLECSGIGADFTARQPAHPLEVFDPMNNARPWRSLREGRST